MTNENATPIGLVLQSLLRQSGLDKKVQEHTALALWDELVGAQAARATSSKTIQHGTMMVKMVSSVWRMELFMRREELRTQINARAGAEVVKELIIR